MALFGLVTLRRAHRAIVALAGALSVRLAMTVAAAAAPVDTASDYVLIHAYQTFVTGVLSDLPAWRKADNAYISKASASCSNVLAAVNLLPPNQANSAAALAFGEEVGGDLLVSQGPLMLHGLERLENRVSPLHWSSRDDSTTVKEYLRAENALYSLAPSDLCADAKALAASNASATPPGSLQWLARFASLATKNVSASGAFGALLGRYQSSRDTDSLKHVLKLLKRWQSVGQNTLQQEGTKLLAALGLTS